MITRRVTYRAFESCDRGLVEGQHAAASWIEFRVSAASPGHAAAILPELYAEALVDGRFVTYREDIGPNHTVYLSPESPLAEILICRSIYSVVRGTVDGTSAEGFVYDLYWHGMQNNAAFREWILRWAGEGYRRLIETP